MNNVSLKLYWAKLKGFDPPFSFKIYNGVLS